jgi:uncharacterized membrane protein AbrB (regulator of aidB expression)
MIAAVVAVFAGVTISMPDWLRAAAFIFLGIRNRNQRHLGNRRARRAMALSIAFLGLTVVAVTW